MGKRSNFERKPRDNYPTPYEAVKPLFPHLYPNTRFDEPCVGGFDLVDHLESEDHISCRCNDIAGPYGCDALTLTDCWGDCFITNPPWTRCILHPLIIHLSDIAPTWLLFDADWMHTKQSAPYMERCDLIVSIGRVKWIPGSKMTGKDNCAWYRFSAPRPILNTPPQFYGRNAA